MRLQSAEEALEEALEDAVTKNVTFLSISGSRLYGTARFDEQGNCLSDMDYRGWTIPPFEYLIGVKTFNDMDVPGADHKVYSLKRFLDLTLSGDPQTTELLYTTSQHWVTTAQNCVADKIFAIRDDIVSNRIYARIIGYGYSEFRKAMGVYMEVGERTKDEDDIIAWIRDKKQWDRERMNEFVEWMEEDKPRKIVSSVKNLGAKRKAEFDKFGFGVSSACHALRLTDEVTELITSRTLTFPRPNAKLLSSIRKGDYSKQEFEQMYEETLAKAKEAHDKSVLNDKPNLKKVWDTYISIIRDYLRTDARFHSNLS